MILVVFVGQVKEDRSTLPKRKSSGVVNEARDATVGVERDERFGLFIDTTKINNDDEKDSGRDWRTFCSLVAKLRYLVS